MVYGVLWFLSGKNKINMIFIKKHISTNRHLIMNIQNLINKVIKGNLKSSKLTEEEEILNTPGLLSNEYQKKLALIIKNFEDIDKLDLKFVEHQKLGSKTSEDLFTSYRLDFHSKEALIRFKKKYKDYIL